MFVYEISSRRLKLPHNSLQFRLTNTCLFDQFTLLSVGRGSAWLKQTLKQCTRWKISISRNNLLQVLWQMLEASDEIDLKPSLRACSRGRDFISVSKAFLAIIFFSNMCFFLLTLWTKRGSMVGQKYLKKKTGPHVCLRGNNYSFLWWA